MLLTVPVKLLVDRDQRDKLLKTMSVLNAACNYISAWCFEKKVFSKFKIQKAIYRNIRDRFGLSSELAIRAIAKVAASYRTDKTICHSFEERGAIEYDVNLLNWKKLDCISIRLMKERLKNIPIVFGEYSKLKERIIKKSAQLIYRKGKFYLQAIVDIPEEELKSCQDYVGYDLGIINIATSNTGQQYSGEQVEKVRVRYTTLRSKLQSVGTKSAKRHLQKISKKERNFKKNTNHIISKQIVSEAKRHNVGIAVEDLQRIRKTVSKSQRDRHGKWAFYELLTFIAYKAKLLGVPVIKVDPRNTSRACSQCSHCEKANRRGEEFVCKKCGFQLHADENAAINIRHRAISAQHFAEKLISLLSWAAVNQPIVANNKRSPTPLDEPQALKRLASGN